MAGWGCEPVRIDLQTGFFHDEEHGFGQVVSMVDRRGRETLDISEASRAIVQLIGCDLRRELWVNLGEVEAETVN